IEHGDRIAQIVILETPTITLEEVDELSSTERGSGGFGSSGMGL
ncbi:MAG: deoxyuridine 5'-triphosphate nucleotidohydrolase, partial [Exiguobacterium sp.]|nr:deoxyuridine 5'-triphosphate nucleotidohydrolase [Exiguobacterium sp.]